MSAYVLLWVLSSTDPSAAVARERAVALDEAGEVFQLSGAEAEAVPSLAAYLPFEVVQLVQVEREGAGLDDGFELVVVRKQGAERTRQRVSLPPALVKRLRAEVSALNAGASAAPSAKPVAAPKRKAARDGDSGPRLNQEGRLMMLASFTGVGLGFYTWAVPVALQTNTQVGVGMGLVLGGASFFAPFFLTSNMEVTWGMANMTWLGLTRGIAHGVLLGAGTRQSFEGTLGLGVLFSVGEGLVGPVWAALTNMSPGTAYTIGAGSDFGLLYGLALSALIVPDSGFTVEPLLLSGVGGAAVGIAGGALLAHLRPHTWGDMQVVSTAGMLGGGLAWSLWLLRDVSDMTLKSFAAYSLAGMTAGLVASELLLAPRHYTFWQSALVSLITYAGGAVGLGGAFVLGVQNNSIFLWGMGAAAGAFIASSLLVPDITGFGGGEEASAFNIHVDPTALVLDSLPTATGLLGPARPVLSVSGRF